MIFYVITFNPSDYPGKYVVRPWLASDEGRIAGRTAGLADTLDKARRMVPQGLARLERAPSDDPVIVETWA